MTNGCPLRVNWFQLVFAPAGRPADAVALEVLFGHRLVQLAAVLDGVLVAQESGPSGPGVFPVEVHLSREQRLAHGVGAHQARLPLDRRPRFLQGLDGDLAEDQLLGKLLRTDSNPGTRQVELLSGGRAAHIAAAGAAATATASGENRGEDDQPDRGGEPPGRGSHRDTFLSSMPHRRRALLADEAPVSEARQVRCGDELRRLSHGDQLGDGLAGRQPGLEALRPPPTRRANPDPGYAHDRRDVRGHVAKGSHWDSTRSFASEGMRSRCGWRGPR